MFLARLSPFSAIFKYHLYFSTISLSYLKLSTSSYRKYEKYLSLQADLNQLDPHSIPRVPHINYGNSIYDNMRIYHSKNQIKPIRVNSHFSGTQYYTSFV